MTAATTTEGTGRGAGRELTTGGIFKGAAIGAGLGAAGNALLFFLGGAAGMSMIAELAKGQPPMRLAFGQVLVASFVPALFAALFTLLLNRFLARPSKVLVGVAIVFGLLSMGGPATVPGAEGAFRMLLAMMHVVSGVAIVGGILRFARAR